MTDKILEKLEKLGLKVTWDGKHVRYVTFPLSPEEWCSLCMRDGEHYVGGCCGNTGVIQDHFCMVFRDSGGADASTVVSLMKTASSHDGFGLYKSDMKPDMVDWYIGRWEQLKPADKIGICCQAVKDKLNPEALELPSIDRKEPEDFLKALGESLGLLRYQDWMFDAQEKKNGKRHANREVLLARVLAACRRVMDISVPAMSEPFRGFAVVHGRDEIMKDNHGYCIYREEKEALQVLDMWKKAVVEAKKENQQVRIAVEKLTVKRISVDARGGIVWPKVGA